MLQWTRASVQSVAIALVRVPRTPFQSPRLLQRASGGTSAVNHRAAAASQERRCPLGYRTPTSWSRDFISTRAPLASSTVPDHVQAVLDCAQHPRRSQAALHNRHSFANSGHAQPRPTSFISEQQVRTTRHTSQDRRASVFVLRTCLLEQPAESTKIYYGHSNSQIASENSSIQTRLWLLKDYAYYSFPNIDKSNNCFSYSPGANAPWFEIIIPEGNFITLKILLSSFNEKWEKIVTMRKQ